MVPLKGVHFVYKIMARWLDRGSEAPFHWLAVADQLRTFFAPRFQFFCPPPNCDNCTFGASMMGHYWNLRK